MVLDGASAVIIVGTEPPSVSGGAARDIRNVGVGVTGIGLGVIGGGVNLRLLVGRAAVEASPFAVDSGDGEVSREPDLRSIFNGRVEVLGGAISINVDEAVRRLDGVVSGTRSSEIVCNGNWW